MTGYVALCSWHHPFLLLLRVWTTSSDQLLKGGSWERSNSDDGTRDLCLQSTLNSHWSFAQTIILQDCFLNLRRYQAWKDWDEPCTPSSWGTEPSFLTFNDLSCYIFLKENCKNREGKCKNIPMLQHAYRCHIGDLQKYKISSFALTTKIRSQGQQFNAWHIQQHVLY